MEKWKHVIGYKGLYAVSDFGRVMSLARRIYNPGRGSYEIVGRIMKPEIITGYLRVNLCKYGITRHKFVHVLVAHAFIGPPPEGKECNHINKRRDDPRLENLEYLSKDKNRATRFGHCNMGSVHGMHKLTEVDVIEIRKRRGTGEGFSKTAHHSNVYSPRKQFRYPDGHPGNIRTLAHEFNVSPALIALICNRTIWKHI